MYRNLMLVDPRPANLANRMPSWLVPQRDEYQWAQILVAYAHRREEGRWLDDTPLQRLMMHHGTSWHRRDTDILDAAYCRLPLFAGHLAARTLRLAVQSLPETDGDERVVELVDALTAAVFTPISTIGRNLTPGRQAGMALYRHVQQWGYSAPGMPPLLELARVGMAHREQFGRAMLHVNRALVQGVGPGWSEPELVERAAASLLDEYAGDDADSDD